MRGVSTAAASATHSSPAAAAAASTSSSAGGSAAGGGKAICRCPINWPLFSSLAKGAALALALDDAGNTTTAAATATAPPAAAADVELEESRLAGLVSFALASAVPGPRAALALGKARATRTAASGGAGAGGGGSVLSSSAAAAATGGSMAAARGPGGRGVCTELAGVVSAVRLVRPGLAGRLCASVGGGAGGGGGGVVVKEYVVRCAMTEPQAKVYSAVAR